MVVILNRQPRLSYRERNTGWRLSGAQACFVAGETLGREYQCSDPEAAGGKLVDLALESGRMAEQGQSKTGLKNLREMKSPSAFIEENILKSYLIIQGKNKIHLNHHSC